MSPRSGRSLVVKNGSVPRPAHQNLRTLFLIVAASISPLRRWASGVNGTARWAGSNRGRRLFGNVQGVRTSLGAGAADAGGR